MQQNIYKYKDKAPKAVAMIINVNRMLGWE